MVQRASPFCGSAGDKSAGFGFPSGDHPSEARFPLLSSPPDSRALEPRPKPSGPSFEPQGSAQSRSAWAAFLFGRSPSLLALIRFSYLSWALFAKRASGTAATLPAWTLSSTLVQLGLGGGGEKRRAPRGPAAPGRPASLQFRDGLDQVPSPVRPSLPPLWPCCGVLNRVWAKPVRAARAWLGKAVAPGAIAVPFYGRRAPSVSPTWSLIGWAKALFSLRRGREP
jgi:hypothetical protein